MTEIRLPQLGQVFPGVDRVGTQRGADSTKTQVWKREMERIQLAAWFQPVQIGQALTPPAQNWGPETPRATSYAASPAPDAPIQATQTSNLSGSDAELNAASTPRKAIDDAIAQPATGVARNPSPEARRPETVTVADRLSLSQEKTLVLDAVDVDAGAGAGAAAAAASTPTVGLPQSVVRSVTGPQPLAMASATPVPATPDASNIANAPVQPGLAAATVDAVVRATLAAVASVQSDVPVAPRVNLQAALEAPTVISVKLKIVNLALAVAIDGGAKPSQAFEASASPSLTKGRVPNPDPQEIRMHAQWSASGVQVWLGIDAMQLAQGQPLAMIVAELQRVLLLQGLCLGAVICNGKMVYQPGPVQGDCVQSETESPVDSQEALQTMFLGRGLPPRVWSQTAYFKYQPQEQ